MLNDSKNVLPNKTKNITANNFRISVNNIESQKNAFYLNKYSVSPSKSNNKKRHTSSEINSNKKLSVKSNCNKIDSKSKNSNETAISKKNSIIAVSFSKFFNKNINLGSSNNYLIPLKAYLFEPTEEMIVDKKTENSAIFSNEEIRYKRLIFNVDVNKCYFNYEKKEIKNLKKDIINQKLDTITDLKNWSDNDLLKFLQSNNWKRGKAISEIIERSKCQNLPFEEYDDLFLNYCQNKSNINLDPKIDKILNKSKAIYTLGRDNCFRPNIYIFEDRFKLLLDEFNKDTIFKSVLILLQFIQTNMLIPGQVETWNLIIKLDKDSILAKNNNDLNTYFKTLMFCFKCRVNNVYIYPNLSSLGIINLKKKYFDNLINENKGTFNNENSILPGRHNSILSNNFNSCHINSNYNVSSTNNMYVKKNKKELIYSLKQSVNPSQLKISFGGLIETVQKYFPPKYDTTDEFFVNSEDSNRLLSYQKFYNKIKNNEVPYKINEDMLNKIRNLDEKNKSADSKISYSDVSSAYNQQSNRVKDSYRIKEFNINSSSSPKESKKASVINNALKSNVQKGFQAVAINNNSSTKKSSYSISSKNSMYSNNCDYSPKNRRNSIDKKFANLALIKNDINNSSDLDNNLTLIEEESNHNLNKDNNDSFEVNMSSKKTNYNCNLKPNIDNNYNKYFINSSIIDRSTKNLNIIKNESKKNNNIIRKSSKHFNEEINSYKFNALDNKRNYNTNFSLNDSSISEEPECEINETLKFNKPKSSIIPFFRKISLNNNVCLDTNVKNTTQKIKNSYLFDISNGIKYNNSNTKFDLISTNTNTPNINNIKTISTGVSSNEFKLSSIDINSINYYEENLNKKFLKYSNLNANFKKNINNNCILNELKAQYNNKSIV